MTTIAEQIRAKGRELYFTDDPERKVYDQAARIAEAGEAKLREELAAAKAKLARARKLVKSMHSELDGFMGDTDGDEDGPLMKLMQAASAFLKETK